MEFLYEFHVGMLTNIFPVLEKCELLCNDLREIIMVMLLILPLMLSSIG